MKPVDQTIFDVPHGNCFAACLASILEFEVGWVPNFMTAEERWFEAASGWCNSIGYTLLLVKRDAVSCGHVDPRPLIDAGHYLIVTGKSPRGDVLHCVVHCHGKMVHDPHPSREGIVEPWVDFIVVIPNHLTKRK